MTPRQRKLKRSIFVRRLNYNDANHRWWNALRVGERSTSNSRTRRNIRRMFLRDWKYKVKL